MWKLPSSERSLRITDLYRERLLALRNVAEQGARDRWATVDLSDFDVSFTNWLGATSTEVSRLQLDSVRLSSAYVTAFLSSELGRRVRPVEVDATRYVGRTRDGRSLAEAYDSPRIGVLVALKDGADNQTALDVGANRALRMVEMDLMHAARTSLLETIDADDRFDGWHRALRGTCGACAGVANGKSGGLHFQVHPGCQCVSEPSVVGVPDRFPRPTGDELFRQKDETEQDEMLGPEVAAWVRSGEVTLADLVAESHLDSSQPDFITQRPVEAL